MQFGINLHEYRRAKKLTLKDVSLKTNIPYQYISEIERNRRNATDDEIKKLMKIFPELNNG